MKIQPQSKKEERALRMAKRSFRWWCSVPACLIVNLLLVAFFLYLFYLSGMINVVLCTRSEDQLIPLDPPVWDFLRYSVFFSLGFVDDDHDYYLWI